MKRLNVQSLFRRLGTIPGLSFLMDWLAEADMVQRRYDQVTGDYMGYVGAAKDGVSEVGGAILGEDEEKEGEGADGERGDGDEGYDDDWEY